MDIGYALPVSSLKVRISRADEHNRFRPNRFCKDHIGKALGNLKTIRRFLDIKEVQKTNNRFHQSQFWRVANGTRNNKIHVVVPYYIIVLSYCLGLRDRGLYVVSIRKWRSADAKGDINGVAFFIFIDELLQKNRRCFFLMPPMLT